MPRLQTKVLKATVPQVNLFKATALLSRPMAATVPLNRTLVTVLLRKPMAATVPLKGTLATVLLKGTLATVLPSRPMVTVLLNRATATVPLSKVTATVLPREEPVMVLLKDKAMAMDHLDHLATVVMVLPRDGATPLLGDRATQLPADRGTLLLKGRAMELPDTAAAALELLATVATTAHKPDMAALEGIDYYVKQHDVHGIKLSV